MSGFTTAEIAAVLGGHRTLQMVRRYARLYDQHIGAVVERKTKKFFSRQKLPSGRQRKAIRRLRFREGFSTPRGRMP